MNEQEKAKMNSWKAAFWIVFVVAIIELLFIGWIFSLGIDATQGEEDCYDNICTQGDYDAYYYDSNSGTCYCYNNNEITKKEVIR